VSSTTYFFPFVTLIHEYRKDDWHRLLVIRRGGKNTPEYDSGWRPYDEIATISDGMLPEYRASSWCATTEYWEGIFPRVFKTEAAEEM
jgi:hypothetical protein